MPTKRRESELFEWRSARCWRWFSARVRDEEEVRTFLSRFGGFVAFHGCRPSAVESYYRSGLHVADHRALTRAARRIFFSPEFPEITEKMFDAITSDIPGGDDHKTYVVLDDQELVRWCGHYLIYGSEHICGIAAALTRDGGRDYRQILKRFGIPSIFRLELPISIIPSEQIEQLAMHLSERSQDFIGAKTPPYFSWSFIFDTSVPAHCVVSHLYPEIVPDPLLKYLPYRYREDGSFYECL